MTDAEKIAALTARIADLESQQCRGEPRPDCGFVKELDQQIAIERQRAEQAIRFESAHADAINELARKCERLERAELLLRSLVVAFKAFAVAHDDDSAIALLSKALAEAIKSADTEIKRLDGRVP